MLKDVCFKGKHWPFCYGKVDNPLVLKEKNIGKSILEVSLFANQDFFSASYRKIVHCFCDLKEQNYFYQSYANNRYAIASLFRHYGCICC